MNTSHVWQVASSILLSIGGGGVIIFALSSWLGKIWADRLMAKETAAHSSELESLRAKLNSEHDRASHTYRQKIDLYKEVGVPLIKLVTVAQTTGRITEEALHEFEVARLSSTALLGMFAPKDVFDNYNHIIDYIFDTMDGKATWSFETFRDKALHMLSLMRRDVGLYQDDLTYTGNR